MKVPKLKKYMDRFASGQLIEKLTSDLNPVLEVIRVGEKTLLNSSNTNYSYGGLHQVFQKAFKKIKPDERKIEHALILGFGAGSIATILREELLIECHITGVENDPEVIRLGKKYFDTARFHHLEIVEMDAAEYIRGKKLQYDFIVVDVYVDFEVPDSCQTIEFVTNMNNALRPGGMILFNKLIYNHQAGTEATELENKFRTLAGTTSVIKVRENVVNKIIVYEKP